MLAWETARRAVAARRRLVAALLAGLAVLSALSALRPPAPPSVTVLAAARDLPPGAALALTDLRPVALPAAVVPEGALRPGAEVLGRLLAGPVRRGEPLTDVRLVGPALLASLTPGTVAVPVRFADPGAVALLRPGDRLDVLAATDPTSAGAALAPADPAALAGSPPPAAAPGSRAGRASGAAGAAAGQGPARRGTTGPGAQVVAADVMVLAVPVVEAAFGDGALVIVACTPAVARALAAAGAYARLSPALRPPGPPPARPLPPAAGRPTPAPP